MTGSKRFRLPLDARESSRLYWELARRGAFATGEHNPWKYDKLSEEEFLTLALLQSRYDPRMLAVLIDYFRKPIEKLNPLRFKEVLRRENSLPIAAVVGQFLLEFSGPVQVKELFRFLMAGVAAVPTQLFYRGLYRIGGNKMEEAVTKPPWAFKKWGFLAADPPLLKERRLIEKTYLYDQTGRLAILREFSSVKKRFRLKDYLREIDFSVSRQQALKDIKAAGGIKKIGKNKGTFYRSVH